jgi:RHS repeat-associated protein
VKVKSITYNELNNLCWEEGNLQQGFSDIGNGGLIEITNHVEELGHPFEELRTMQEEGIGETFYQCIGLGVTKQLPDLYNTVELFSNTQVNPDEPSFYYTTDHLGSSSYLTNDLGQTTQIIAYMPYGEDWVNRNFTQNFRSNYKYNGKEKDPESGYYNYGARYYGGNLPIWLSVDPLSDKYPHLTPYAYCAGNPVMLVDPDGRKCVVAEEDQAYVNQLLDENSDNYSKGFADIYKRLDDSDHIYNFKSVKSDGFKDKDKNNISGLFTPNNSPNESLIQFTKDDNPDLLDKSLGASTYRPLFEETFHAFQYERDGATESSAMKEAEAWKFSATAPGTKYHFKDKSGNYNMTVMGNIFFGSQNQVAFWLKFGKNFGNGVQLDALYNHLPYNLMRINSKTWKFENVY